MSKKLLNEIKELKEKIAKQEKVLRTLEGTLRAKVVTLQGICKHPVNKVVAQHRSNQDTLGNWRDSDSWWCCTVCHAKSPEKNWEGFRNDTKEVEFKRFTGREYKYPKLPNFSRKAIHKALYGSKS